VAVKILIADRCAEKHRGDQAISASKSVTEHRLAEG
jgi:hypothetical protein